MIKYLMKPGLWVFWVICLGFFACKSMNNKVPTDSPYQGTIHISVDESFKPVIEEQIKMYEESYPGTKIIAHYKPEAECIKDIFTDSLTRTAIITRGLLPGEEAYLKDSLKYNPSWNQLATDAIAIVVNIENTDTLYSLQKLRELLQGKSGSDKVVVFDGLSATSTLRFIMDSVLKGAKVDTSVVKARKNSPEVLDFVANSVNAVGLVGTSWIGNPEVPEQLALLKKIKICYVQCDLCEGEPFVKPMQESILTHRYPLVRGLFYVNRENYTGLGTGFVNFMKNERGQLIFKRYYLGPIMELEVRNVKINEKLPNN